jgi:hypothetical protein
MPFDPYGVLAYHKSVRERIDNGDPGLAQTFIGRELASYAVEDGQGYFAGNVAANIDAVEELILDVARKEGIASSQVFAMARITWMIADRDAYPSNFPKKHAEAALLRELVKQRPELFF